MISGGSPAPVAVAQLETLGVMATLLPTLIMAAVSALAFIAYRHPKGYARIYIPLMVILLASWLLWFVASLGYETGFSRGMVAVMQINHKALDLPEQPHTPVWFFILPSAFIIYLQFLRFLPVILDLPTKDSEPNKPKDKVSEKGSEHDT